MELTRCIGGSYQSLPIICFLFPLATAPANAKGLLPQDCIPLALCICQDGIPDFHHDICIQSGICRDNIELMRNISCYIEWRIGGSW